jgi:hypothetical protein
VRSRACATDRAMAGARQGAMISCRRRSRG